jgi:prevent-host-death family protein
MKALGIKQATAPLADYVRNIGKEPVVVSVGGKPVAALVSLKNSDWETVRLSCHPQFLALIQRSRERQEKEGGISSQDMRRRLGLPTTKQRQTHAREKAPRRRRTSE